MHYVLVPKFIFDEKQVIFDEKQCMYLLDPIHLFAQVLVAFLCSTIKGDQGRIKGTKGIRERSTDVARSDLSRR